MNTLVFQEPPVNFNPTLEVAACFIRVDKQMLFMKRHPRKSEGDKWGIPDGCREKGEQASETVIREIQEEAGIALVHSQLEHKGTVFIRYPEVDFIYHMFEHVLDSFPSLLMMSEEHTDYRWITLEEAITLPLIRGEEECIYLAYEDSLLLF